MTPALASRKSDCVAFREGMIPLGGPPNGQSTLLREWLPVCQGAEASWAWSQRLERAAYVLKSAVGSMDHGGAARAVLCARMHWSS